MHMQRPLDFKRRSDGEIIKDGGFVLDFDEIAKAGKISKEEAFIAKWYGIYEQRQPGNYMARVVLPGGLFSTAQARVIARIAENHAQGKIAFTTRQTVQFHWLKVKGLPEMIRALDTVGLSTYHGCGDVNRNVMSCPMASSCSHRRIDVMPAVQKTAAALANQHDLDDLPRKFKISFNGCNGDCALPYMNDIGMMAIERNNHNNEKEYGYKVVIGGGHSWSPFVASPLFGFVPQDRITELCRAIVLLFRDHGDRWNRLTARLKFVVYRLGVARCREIVLANLAAENVNYDDFIIEPVEDTGPPIPARPLTIDTHKDPASEEINVGLTGTDGLICQRIKVPKGELNFRGLNRLADLSEIYGDKYLRVNHRQNVEIHGVRSEDVLALRNEIEKLSFATTDFFGLSDIVSCVGLTYCPMAVSRTHDLVELLPFLGDKKYDDIRDAVQINITGCPNSCSPYKVVDIGLRGARLRELEGSVEGYQVAIGGSQHSYGQSIGTYKTDDCVRIIQNLLKSFAGLRHNTESFTETLTRVGLHPFTDSVKALNIQYEMAQVPSEYSSPEDGTIQPLDEQTINKDVPCRAACPAATQVPWYIQKIAEGDLDTAYRINQEDNVFPGVLGRICTRPCEAACRHQWTNTQGPVAICHLKRAAADRKSAPPVALPHWFESTDKTIAIVGSGPSGLTAARELSRYGHRVVILEQEHVLGGMMRLSIPPFRLPRQVLDEEIAAIIDSGVEVRTGVEITWDGLDGMTDEYDAVLMAAGTIKARGVKLSGAPDGLALSGLQFMKDYCLHKPMTLKAPVLIVGGGFTAIDCARAARRVLGTDGGAVSLLVRRTQDLMSAEKEELDQLTEEDITIQTLVSPLSATVVDNQFQSVTLQRNMLGAPGADGRPTVQKIEGNTTRAECGTLIYAIGQTQALDLSEMDVEPVDEVSTSRENLFMAGDYQSGSLDVIHAVASGKKAADAMDLYLVGKKRRHLIMTVNEVVGGESGRLRDHDLVSQPHQTMLAPTKRLTPAEVEQGFAIEAAKTSAERCYWCQFKYEIDQDKCIHCDWCIKAAPRDCIRRVTRLFTNEEGAAVEYVETGLPEEGTFIWIDSHNCIRCGNCFRACPMDAIRATKVTLHQVSCPQAKIE
jgi:sulfite reductase beta subunit-like hemoprotein/NADPH-dependent glutamate synthase beta subunit-like oxidoreductase/ferredoxin